MAASIVGFAHSRFGRLPDETLESLIVRAARDAISDAGIGAADIDEIVLGHFNAGFCAQDFTAALTLVIALIARAAGAEDRRAARVARRLLGGRGKKEVKRESRRLGL